MGGDGISLEVEMRADVAKATMLADCELRQDWRERRPEQKRGMEVVALFLLE